MQVLYMSYVANCFTEIANCDTVQKIVTTIASNDVVVISGETGCGKTTQVLSMLYKLFSARNFFFVYD